MDAAHKATISHIQNQIREHFAKKVPFRVYHGSTNSTRVLTFKRREMIDISALNRVLSIDKAKRTAIAEPNVPMDKLVRETLKHGLIPPVVTEFPGITVGGGIQGTAAETSSFRWGCFSQTVNWMEMILGDGKQLVVSPHQHADLFFGTAGSCGSLGLVTAAEIQLIPAKRYVTITHLPVSSFEEAVRVSQEYTQSPYDFIERLMFRRDHGSVIIGKLSDDITGKLRRFSRAFDPWYYLYAEKLAGLRTQITDTVPLKDYLFRYNRGAFWGGRLAFEHFGVKFTALNRFILDPLLRTRKLYQALQESAAAQTYICQDIIPPTKSVAPFMNFIDKEFNMYPTGFCPIKPEPRSPCNPTALTPIFFLTSGFMACVLCPTRNSLRSTNR